MPVSPEFVMPIKFDRAELRVPDGQRYRVELLDVTGKTMPVATPND